MVRVQWSLGAAAIALVALLQLGGLTRVLEYPAIDLRSRLFGASKPALSDKVAIIGIDDASLWTIGKWPWSRDLLAEAVRELFRAGASVVVLDLLLEDPQPPRIEGDLRDASTLRTINEDQIFADAIRENGATIIAASFAALRESDRNRTLPREDVGKRVGFLDVLESVRSKPEVSLSELRDGLLTGAFPGGPAIDDLERKRQRAKTLISVGPRWSVHAPVVGAWPLANEPTIPVPAIAEAAAGIGSASFAGGDLDGAVRRLPLWVGVQDRLYPSLGLAAACRFLGIGPDSVRVEPLRTVLNARTGPIEIPTHSAPLLELRHTGAVDGQLFVTWPRSGFDGWQSQFTSREQQSAGLRHEIPIGRLLDPLVTVGRGIRQNIGELDRNLLAAGEQFGIVQIEDYQAGAEQLRSAPLYSTEWRAALSAQKARWRAAAQEARGILDQSQSQSEALTEPERLALANLQSIAADVPRVVGVIDTGVANVDSWRDKELPARVEGRVCLIGWTATAAAADMVRTSIDSRTPGVHVHAAVVESILGSIDQPRFRVPAPLWADLLAVIMLGVIGTVVAIGMPVVASPLALLGALAAWFAADGLILWDFGNTALASGGPIAAAVGAWLLVMLHRLVVEQRSRLRTEARFRSYVSPDVVDILVGNPDLDSMAPQRRELTIFFSDIAGFTTLSERLGTEGIARLLNTYLGAMTDVLQAHKATIDKYLGDGIMAFWGAPLDDPEHARHAVAATSSMLARLAEMNGAGAFGPAGQISIRVGLASGDVNVGDFGHPPHKSSYTVIGDAANIAARLESANKQFGTTVLMNEPVRRALGPEHRCRLIGKVILVGKHEPESVYELVVPRGHSEADTARWIDANDQAIRAYMEGRFDDARRGFNLLRTRFNDDKLADVYLRALDSAAAKAPGSKFDGTIELVEK